MIYQLRRAFTQLRDVTPITPALAVSGSRGARSPIAHLYATRLNLAPDLDQPHATRTVGLDPDKVDPQAFETAVETTIDAMRAGGVLVNCHEGRERAPTVAATALAIVDDISCGDAFNRVRWARPRTDPTPDLRRASVRFIKEHRA